MYKEVDVLLSIPQPTLKLTAMSNINSIIKACICMLFAVVLHSSAVAQSVVASGYTFTASTTTYNYLSGGTRVTPVEVDDAYTTIPIGFPFKFCGTIYNDVTVCSNGWLRFGTGAGSGVANWNYNAQSSSGIYPCVYALYEDVSGVGGISSYLVTGTSPNRIFKWECRNWLWDYAASTPCVSFQVWLHEATGVVECIYQQESGAVALNTSGGATIGIANSGTDWQTLDNVTASPTSSSTTYTYTLASRPATGQSYMWDPGPACPAPTGLATTFVNSTNVDFSWTAVTGTLGYEYMVNQNATPPSAPTPTFTTATNVSLSGLTPATTYYIHLRTKCGNNNFSNWVTITFNTLPPCVINTPAIQIPYIDSNSATVIWPGTTTALDYQYVIKQDKSFPIGGAGVTTTSVNSINITNLESGKTYYIFLRVRCQGNDSSMWIMDSIYVPIPCRAPDVKFDALNDNRVVAYWGEPQAAYEYELINTTIQMANPIAGIKMTNNSYLLPFLNPDTKYYVYARSYCKDREVKSVSPWSSATYDTWPLSIHNTDKDNALIKLYPNPVFSQLNVNVGMHVAANGVIKVLDFTGKVLLVKEVSDNIMTLDVSQLSTGIYLLQYSINGNNSYLKINKM